MQHAQHVAQRARVVRRQRHADHDGRESRHELLLGTRGHLGRHIGGERGGRGAALELVLIHELIAVDRDAQQARILEQRNQRAHCDERDGGRAARERRHLLAKVGRVVFK